MFLADNSVFTGYGLRKISNIADVPVKIFDGGLWIGNTFFHKDVQTIDYYVNVLLPNKKVELAPTAKILLDDGSTKLAKNLRKGDCLYFVPLVNNHGIDDQDWYVVKEVNIKECNTRNLYFVDSLSDFVTLDSGIIIKT